jgi:hypothetical protein
MRMYFPTEAGQQDPEIENPYKESALAMQRRRAARKRKAIMKAAPEWMTLGEAIHLAIEKALERSLKHR